jgi:Ca2+-transporting ATPase
VLKANQRMAGQALRVLGMAASDRGGDPRDERELTWLGLAGLANPIRRAAPPAIKVLHQAGIRTVMITGDQSATAFAIARELDLADGDEVRVLEAGQIKGVDRQVLAAIAANPHVFARVSPVDKLEIVRALQAGGRIVAMTGDGINDGPALKAADIGIAMGGGGTDVAREVADIVLATDELGGVIEAVRLGRATYANIRKVLRFLVGTNAAETLVMLGASIAGWPEPLHPMQLLWLNLVTDVLPGLALGLEPPEPDVLDERPHDPRAPILAPADFRRLLAEGSVIGGTTLATFLLEGGLRDPRHAGPTPLPTRASTVAFHALTMAQLAHALACRSEHHGLFEELRRPPNRRLYAALAACTGLQVGAQALPFTRRLLGLAPLRVADLAVVGGATVVSVALNELVGRAILARTANRPATPANAPARPQP